MVGWGVRSDWSGEGWMRIGWMSECVSECWLAGWCVGSCFEAEIRRAKSGDTNFVRYGNNRKHGLSGNWFETE